LYKGEKVEELKHNLFVYGTLREGQSRNNVFRDADYLGVKETKPYYTMYSLGSFPALTTIGNTEIVGEVYKVSDYTLEVCDMIEGHPTFYQRLPIELQDESIEDPLAYFIVNRDWSMYSKIDSGNWVKELL
jgi:gamma-glutamylcyclotransferase (GGCT)/AIG2-like uncharacterized protein YtfP